MQNMRRRAQYIFQCREVVAVQPVFLEAVNEIALSLVELIDEIEARGCYSQAPTIRVTHRTARHLPAPRMLEIF